MIRNNWLACIGFAIAISGAGPAKAEAPDAGRFAANAKAVIASMTPSRSVVVQNPKGKWFRTDDAVISSNVDVKRTDSILDPVQGFVDLDMRFTVYSSAATKEEAAIAPQADVPPFIYKIRAIFVPVGSGWQLKSAQVQEKGLGGWSTIKPENLRTQIATIRFPERVLIELETR